MTWNKAMNASDIFLRGPKDLIYSGYHINLNFKIKEEYEDIQNEL